MSSVGLALPVLIGSVTIHVAKGRRWSIVEHLLLDAACRQPRTTEELAAAAGLPERMVVESFIGLMRAGWAELRTEDRRSLFAATAGGRAVVDGDELPVVTQLAKRSVRYAIEQLGGTVLRYRELDFVWAARFHSQGLSGFRPIERASQLPEVKQGDVVSSMLMDDEEYRGMVPNTARQARGYALLSVSGDKVKGLPSGTSDALRKAIVSAAADLRPEVREDEPLRLPAVPKAAITMPPRRITFSNDDVLIGGEPHRDLLRNAVRAARSNVVIHSTFVGTGDWLLVVSDVAEAARDRGVRTDILWGKGDRPEQENATRSACERINAEMKSVGLQRFVRAHAFSTGSHAKLLVADDGRGGWNATVGSCNWLSSGFTSTEASVRLSDSLIVSDVMEAMSQMAHRVTGLNGGIAGVLASQAVNIRRSRSPSTAKRGEVRLILGHEHAETILTARDRADRSILLGSHKIGRAARTLALLPAAAAADLAPDRKGARVRVEMFYDEVADSLSREAAAALIASYAEKGVIVRRAASPGMHAKFLAWDDDHLLVTSQNLLSADPIDPFAELGLLIAFPGVAGDFRSRMGAILS